MSKTTLRQYVKRIAKRNDVKLRQKSEVDSITKRRHIYHEADEIAHGLQYAANKGTVSKQVITNPTHTMAVISAYKNK